MLSNTHIEPIVSVKWLNDHLHDENLLVFDASMKKVTANVTTSEVLQIPDAQFFDIKNVFSVKNATFPNTVPSVTTFTNEAQKLGVNANSTIIVYDDKGIYSSARVWYLFKAFGFHNVAVLNGGLPEWKAAGYELKLKNTQKKLRGNYIAKYNSEMFRFFDDIQNLSNNSDHLIIDARSENRFKGIVDEPRKGLRSGKIPSSVNIPFSNILDGNCYKSKEDIKIEFDKVNTNDKHLVFSCGSGITACVLALGAELIGNTNSSVYDGSWTEYGTLTTNIMEHTHWTKKELVAYILLYTAHSNFEESNLEKNVIISKVDMQTFQKIHDEFDKDNDYQSLQKIIQGVEQHQYNSNELKSLFTDIKTLFLSDGEYDIMERNMFLFLKKILN